MPEYLVLETPIKGSKTLELAKESLAVKNIGVLEPLMYLGAGDIETKEVSEIEAVKWVVFKLTV